MQFAISHFEIKVRDLPTMEKFYTHTLGFLLTDRSQPGGHQMVFLSRNAGEHHQVVLREAEDGSFSAGSFDHLAFRVEDLTALRKLHGALISCGDLAIETVCHGTTWSIYFRDPEDNRIEFFVETPWHVAQPVRFPIDLSLADDDLMSWTKDKLKSLADFQPSEQWFQSHRKRLESELN